MYSTNSRLVEIFERLAYRFLYKRYYRKTGVFCSKWDYSCVVSINFSSIEI